MAQGIRVRYAPSPTGEPHVGNVRTALFNWLFARRHDGQFVVRIEDTDQDRAVPGAVERILESLHWLEIDWDEGPDVGGPYGPYRQSERLELYHRAVDELEQQGHAYRCYCPRERLEELRQQRAEQRLPPGYDGHCRNLTEAQRRQHEAHGDTSVVRFKMPPEGETVVHDLIRGDVIWQNGLLDDLVLLKSDGFPTYHLANVVDDHHMEISHVLRAEEWLPSTPRHIRIYEALGYQSPLFGHLPMILGPDRAKLSKRHGATALLEYRDAGFLPEALVNFMALLGWSLDDKTDIISRRELVQNFSLERVGKAGAIFDKEKLLWMNGVYIRSLPTKELARRARPFIEDGLGLSPQAIDQEQLVAVMALLQERLKTLAEASQDAAFFFQEVPAPEPALLVQKGMDAEGTRAALERVLDALKAVPVWEHEELETIGRALCQELGVSARQLFGAMRVAVTGRAASPPLFQTMEVLGRERCLQRIEAAIRSLSG